MTTPTQSDSGFQHVKNGIAIGLLRAVLQLRILFRRFRDSFTKLILPQTLCMVMLEPGTFVEDMVWSAGLRDFQILIASGISRCSVAPRSAEYRTCFELTISSNSYLLAILLAKVC